MTLLEVLISSALFSLVIAGVYVLYSTMQITLSRGELKSDLQQNARVGMDQMVQELRMAGYNASGSVPPGEIAFRGASAACVSFVAADPGSGAAVQITYDLNGSTLRRESSAGGGAQGLAGSISALAFTYFDGSSQVIIPSSVTTAPCASSAGLTWAQLRQVRRVAILLRTLGNHPRVSPEFFTLTSDVRIRNR